MKYDILINNGMLITMEDELPVIEKGSVLIKDGVIEDCGRSEKFLSVKAGRKIDAGSKIIMPGLVNTPIHMYPRPCSGAWRMTFLWISGLRNIFFLPRPAW